MWAEAHTEDTCSLGKSSASLGKGWLQSTWLSMMQHEVPLVKQVLHIEWSGAKGSLTDYVKVI